MKIYTLGTSHGDSTFSRFNSSTLYETEDESLYLVDAGAPVEALIRRKGLNIKNLRVVFITHLHDDHAGGLTGLIKQVIKYSDGRKEPLKIFLPESDAADTLIAWLKVLHLKDIEKNISFCVTTPNSIYSDRNISVSAVQTAHVFKNEIPCSFGYIISENESGKTILHTGDLSCNFKDFPQIAYEKHFDLCLCEATHHKPEQAVKFLKQANFDRMLFIHIGDMWHIYLNGSNWNFKNGEKELLSHYKELPYSVVVAHDGDEFYI